MYMPFRVFGCNLVAIHRKSATSRSYISSFVIYSRSIGGHPSHSQTGTPFSLPGIIVHPKTIIQTSLKAALFSLIISPCNVLQSPTKAERTTYHNTQFCCKPWYSFQIVTHTTANTLIPTIKHSTKAHRSARTTGAD